jgi:hypothetical protein
MIHTPCIDQHAGFTAAGDLFLVLDPEVLDRRREREMKALARTD